MYSKPMFRVLLLTAVLLLSCESIKQFVQPPDVKVENVNIADVSFEDITLDFALLINNPNPFGVELDGYNYQFAIEGEEFLSADETREMNIAGGAQSSVQIPISINFERLYNFMQKTKHLDSLSFDLNGQLNPGGLLSGFDIPFNRSGSVPNVKLPQIQFTGIKLKNMGLSGIDMEVGLELINNNVFGFNIGTLNYDIALAGTQIANGATEKLASVPAKGESQVTIPISLSFAGAAASVRSLLRGENVEASISGSTDLETPFGALTLPFDTTQQIPISR